MSKHDCWGVHKIRKTHGRLPTALCIVVALLIGFGLTAQASAQTASFRSVDRNADGVLSFNELVDAFGQAGARRLLERSDHNGDARLTIPELRSSRDDDRYNGDDRDDRNDDDDRDDDNNGDGDGDNGDD